MQRKSKTGKVFVGLSGGVDSGVSAALLKKAGYDVVGAFIRIAIPGYPCTAAQDRIDAMRVAAHVGIPFVEIDLSAEYEQRVFRPSIEGFAQGETPNPDVLCNRQVKFGTFFDFARARGADMVATGHYAQLVRKSSETELHVSTDNNKDQTYFLWNVPEQALSRTLFPIGDKTKTRVRALAKKFGLPNAERPDSQGLCFLGPISMDDMLERELSLQPGDVLAENGEVVGRHAGAARYTLGQRHNFTLLKHGADTKPHYVIAKDVGRNTLTVSPQRFPQGVSKTELTLRAENWIGERTDGRCKARFRYRQELIDAELKGDTVLLHSPHYVPLGQSLVLYRGRRCLGGGIVSQTTLKP